MAQHIAQGIVRTPLAGAAGEIASLAAPVPGKLIEIVVKLGGGVNPNGATNFTAYVDGELVGTLALNPNQGQAILSLDAPVARFATVSIHAPVIPPAGLNPPIFFLFTFEDSQGAIKRSGVTYAVPSLANGATHNSVVALSRSFIAYRVATTVPYRVRLYTRTSYRTADASRAYGTPLPDGCILDVQTSAGSLVYVLPRPVIGTNLEDVVTDDIAVAITNVSGVTQAGSVTITRAPIEGAQTNTGFLLEVDEEGGVAPLSISKLLVAAGDLVDVSNGVARIKTAGDAQLTVEDTLDVPTSIVARKIVVASGDLEELIDGSARIKTASDVILPTTLPPSGAAGGDLSSDYPNPTVSKVAGITPGSPNGVATLDGAGKLLVAQLPAIALVERFSVASQAAMLALTAQPGDFAFRTDLSEVYLLTGADPTVLANWTIWLHPAIPTTLPPSGAAGGDLGATYPNPTVTGLQGNALPASVNNGFLKRNAAGNGWEEVAYGAVANTVAQGNDARLSDSRAPSGAAGGDLGATYPNPTVQGLKGDALPASVAGGFVKRNAANTAWEEIVYGTTANSVTQGNDARLSDARTPTGAAGGDLSGTYANPTVNRLKGRSLGGIPAVSANLSDNFDDNTRDATLWNFLGGLSSGVLEQNGRLEISGDGSSVNRGYETVNTFDITGHYIGARLVQKGGTNSTSHIVYLAVRGTFATAPTITEFSIEIHYATSGVNANNNVIECVHFNGSSGELFRFRYGTIYNPAVHVYFRIRKVSTTWFYDYSTDGSAWTNMTSHAPGTTNAQAGTPYKLRLYVGTATATPSIWDDVISDTPLTDPIIGQANYALMWDNANTQFSLLRALGVIPTTPAGTPPTGAPASVPAGHTLAVAELTNPLKLWIYNTATSAWNSQQF